MAAAIQADPSDHTVTVDPRAQKVVTPDGRTIEFSIAPFEHEMLVAGRNELELTLNSRDRILDFESADRLRRTWWASWNARLERHLSAPPLLVAAGK